MTVRVLYLFLSFWICGKKDVFESILPRSRRIFKIFWKPNIIIHICFYFYATVRKSDTHCYSAKPVSIKQLNLCSQNVNKNRNKLGSVKASTINFRYDSYWLRFLSSSSEHFTIPVDEPLPNFQNYKLFFALR